MFFADLQYHLWFNRICSLFNNGLFCSCISAGLILSTVCIQYTFRTVSIRIKCSLLHSKTFSITVWHFDFYLNTETKYSAWKFSCLFTAHQYVIRQALFSLWLVVCCETIGHYILAQLCFTLYAFPKYGVTSVWDIGLHGFESWFKETITRG